MIPLPTVVDPQHAVIDFLSHPAGYGCPTATDVQRIETHCSLVFLVGDRAYKLKRAIRYASLDYTTAELRERACRAELRLNQRTAPGIYCDVWSINRSPDGMLAFNGPGPAMDFVVVMRQFAQKDLFDQLADRGELTPDLMRALGAAIARFHVSAETMTAFGGSQAIRRVIADNGRELALVGAMLDGIAMEDLTNRSKIAVSRLGRLLDKRRAQGSVRRCHGDLRLANICLYQGQPTLFDCIEFSDEIGCIDVLYDLAFLLMDLHVRGCSDLANVVFNTYLDKTAETDGLRALPLFLSLRAATRSYALAGGARRSSDKCKAARLADLARRHIAAAAGFLVPPPPTLILLGGADSAGRANAANMLAGQVTPAPGARVLRLGRSGNATWREAFAVLAAGCSVLIEGMFTPADERQALAALPLTVQLLPFWLGHLPRSLSRRVWRNLEDRDSAIAAVASALPLAATGRVDAQLFNNGSH
ncbi:MAG TPA: phosphotransferase [Rhodopila sp.]|nr:phosphotransferase [Rhodopila sp.]